MSSRIGNLIGGIIQCFDFNPPGVKGALKTFNQAFDTRSEHYAPMGGCLAGTATLAFTYFASKKIIDISAPLLSSTHLKNMGHQCSNWTHIAFGFWLLSNTACSINLKVDQTPRGDTPIRFTHKTVSKIDTFMSYTPLNLTKPLLKAINAAMVVQEGESENKAMGALTLTTCLLGISFFSCDMMINKGFPKVFNIAFTNEALEFSKLVHQTAFIWIFCKTASSFKAPVVRAESGGANPPPPGDGDPCGTEASNFF